MVTQVEIARRIGIDVSSVNKILNRRRGPIFRQKTIQRVFKVARELGYDFSRLKYAHRRLHPRKEISVPVELSIYVEGGQLFDRGTALLQEASLSGAKLSAIVLSRRAIPTKPHTISIRLPEILKGVEILGRPVRFFQTHEAFGMAVEFEKTETDKAKALVTRRA